VVKQKDPLASNQSLHERSGQEALGSSGGPRINENLTRTSSRIEAMENASKKLSVSS
jgi:hypothetical protein